MSISIAYLTDNYSIVAGDDRATFPTPRNGAKWHDGESKVFQVPFGFVAASGGIKGTKELFKDNLNKYIYKSRKDIWRMFLYAIRDCQNIMKSNGLKSKYLAASRFVYSLNYYQDDVLHMDIETIDFMFNTRRLKAKNALIVNSPKHTKRIKRLEAKYYDLAKNVKDMYEAIYLIACLLDEMAKLTDFISNNVQCGISLKYKSEILLLKIEQNAKIIKKLYKDKGDLSEIMMVCAGV